ncbi:MAG: RNA methyltransferase [Trueperaceae bacterium]|nr:MAG: RNA methyltransferase [Trueperaceae bacterium]
MRATKRTRIDSPQNPTIKALARLKERRQREVKGRFLIEGVRELTRALEGCIPLEQVLICPEFLSNQGRALIPKLEQHTSVKSIETSAAAFKRVSTREHPDGVLATAKSWRTTLNALTLARNSLLLILDGLEKPGNLGALLRTADATNVDAVFITGTGTDIFNPNVVRASMGSLFSRPVIITDTLELIDFLQANRVELIATSPGADLPYWDESYLGSTAILLGTEHGGLTPAWLAAASRQVSIPMQGLADSLNVATSGALLLYEVLRQRRSAAKAGIIWS